MWYMTAGIPRGKWETVYEGPNRKRLMEDGRRWLEAVGPREMGLRVVLAGWREEDVPTDVDRVGGEEGMLERSYDDSLTEWTRPRASLRRSEHVWLKDQTLNKAGVPDYLDILNEARSSKTSRRISAAWRRLHG